MKVRPLSFIASVFFIALASPVHSQEYEVTRRVFTFYEDRLNIEVLATSAGQLQIVQGEAGRIEVAAHASEGVAAFGLNTERGSTLQLTALGAKQADYVVVVPEQTTVRVRLPGRAGWRDAPRYGSSHFRWDATPDTPDLDYSFPKPTMEGRYFIVNSSPKTPSRVRLLHGSHIRSVEVRMEGTEFQLASSQPLTGDPRVSDLIDIDPGTQDVDLVIQVPSFTKKFVLRLDDKTLLSVEDGVMTDSCAPGVRQKTPRGMVRMTFKPTLGLVCSAGSE